MNNSNKLKTILGIIITILALGFSLFVILNGSKEATITIDETTSTVSVGGGLYSKTIEIDQNTIVTMVSPIEIDKRTNGSSVGDVKKGYFTLTGDQKVYLNLSDSKLAWIEIVNDETYYYLNLKSITDTLGLYQDILALKE